MYGLPLKFACLLLSVSPNAVAVVVPARQAYSHWASVGRRNSQPSGSSPDFAGQLGQLAAERLRLGEVDVADRVVVALGQLRRQRARQLADDALPVALRDLVLPGPEALGERHLDLVLARPPLRLVGRAAHRERARRAPAEPDAGDGPLLAGLRAVEPVPCGGKARGGNEHDGQSDHSHIHLLIPIRPPRARSGASEDRVRDIILKSRAPSSQIALSRERLPDTFRSTVQANRDKTVLQGPDSERPSDFLVR